MAGTATMTARISSGGQRSKPRRTTTPISATRGPPPGASRRPSGAPTPPGGVVGPAAGALEQLFGALDATGMDVVAGAHAAEAAGAVVRSRRGACPVGSLVGVLASPAAGARERTRSERLVARRGTGPDATD